MTNILIGITAFSLILFLFFLFKIYKLKKRINQYEEIHITFVHDLKTLLATFRMTLDGLKDNKCLQIAIKNEDKNSLGDLFKLIEIFENIGQGLSKLIKGKDLIYTQCKWELK